MKKLFRKILRRWDVVVMILLLLGMVGCVVAEAAANTMKYKELEAVSRTSGEIISEQAATISEQAEILKKYEGLSNRVRVCRITKYCACMTCCGKTNGITASGTKAKEGRTCAADVSIYPFGTKLYIEGVGWRTVEDVGGAVNGNKIDIYVDDHTVPLEGVPQYAIVIEKQ